MGKVPTVNVPATRVEGVASGTPSVWSAYVS